MDRQAERCSACGHALGIGRFCTNCGHPRGAPPAPSGDAQDTAERAAVPPAPTLSHPVPAPPVYEPPRPARFPLYADETSPQQPVEQPVPGARVAEGEQEDPAGHEVVPGLAPVPAPREPAGDRPRRTSRLGWVAAAVAAIVLLGVGGILLLDGTDDTGSAADPVLPTLPADGTPSDGATPTDPGTTDGSGATPETPSEDPVDVASRAEATPPDTAAPSRDVDGNAVRYEAFNMLDGQADTAWRMPGAASGQEIVFRLDAPTRISEVGLINGYAKVDPGYDGYTANRRITAVEWDFGDGTVIPQDLTDDLGVQRVAVDDVVSDTVTLRILAVTPPARGPAGRDYTAISDVALVGAPA